MVSVVSKNGIPVSQIRSHILLPAYDNRSDGAMLEVPHPKTKRWGDCSPREGYLDTHESHIQMRDCKIEKKLTMLCSPQASQSAVRIKLDKDNVTPKRTARKFRKERVNYGKLGVGLESQVRKFEENNWMWGRGKGKAYCYAKGLPMLAGNVVSVAHRKKKYGTTSHVTLVQQGTNSNSETNCGVPKTCTNNQVQRKIDRQTRQVWPRSAKCTM